MTTGTPARSRPPPPQGGVGGESSSNTQRGLGRAVAAYLGGLRVWQGPRSGESLTLFPWQRRFLGRAFRQPGDAALTVARGAGKTTFVAGIASAAVAGPLVEPGAEVLVVASSFEQGLTCFRHVLGFLRPRFEAEGIGPRGRWRIQDSANRASVSDRQTGALLRVLGSDPKRMHGAAPKTLVLDEVAQYPGNIIEAMLSALLTARGKFPDSRAFWIGTRPAEDAHPFARALAGKGVGYAQVHAARETDPPFRRSTWIRANPSLPWMPHLEAQIREEAEEAKRDPAALARFRSLRLNMGTSDVVERALLDPGTWERIEVERPPRGGWYVLGLDLGTSAAMSGAAGYWPESGGLDALAAFPELPSLEERGLRDAVGNLYRRMEQRGELILAGRRAVEIDGLLREVLERWGPPAVIVCDRWREAELRDRLEAIAFPVCDLVIRGQGYKDGGEDVRMFRRACLSGRVLAARSLLLRAAMGEARVAVDPAGNEKLAKATQGFRRANARDDAAAAAILAVSEGARSFEDAPARGGLRYAIVGQ